MSIILVYSIFFILSFFVSILGVRRNIGVKYSFAISIFLSPFIGLLLTLFSSKYDPTEKGKDKSKLYSGFFILTIGVILIIISIISIFIRKIDPITYEGDVMISGLSTGCGVFTSGLYLINRGKGITFAENQVNTETNNKSISPSLEQYMNRNEIKHK